MSPEELVLQSNMLLSTRCYITVSAVYKIAQDNIHHDKNYMTYLHSDDFLLNQTILILKIACKKNNN